MEKFNAELAIERVVKIINKYYNESKKIINTISKKEVNDIVTDVDIFMEKNIIAELSKFFPTHSFNAEESGETKLKEEGDFYQWIIDPIDGTIQFAAGMPDFGVVVALQKNGETILGVNVLPKLDETYTVIKGKGAFCNGERLQVSSNSKLNDCVVMFYLGCKYNEELRTKTTNLINKLLPKTRAVRIIGSSSVVSSWVASGKVDAVINLKESISFGSTVGRLMIAEAGGKVTNANGNKRKQVDTMLCSNNQIHKEILKEIQAINSKAVEDIIM